MQVYCQHRLDCPTNNRNKKIQYYNQDLIQAAASSADKKSTTDLARQSTLWDRAVKNMYKRTEQ